MIAGSVLTFEHQENGEKYAYDKVVMLAGGVGYGTKRDCLKKEPQPGNKVVVVGGDNYRIGLGRRKRKSGCFYTRPRFGRTLELFERISGRLRRQNRNG